MKYLLCELINNSYEKGDILDVFVKNRTYFLPAKETISQILLEIISKIKIEHYASEEQFGYWKILK